ncbi:Domain of unknown function DUF5642 [Mycobacteriaceae bacterium]
MVGLAAALGLAACGSPTTPPPLDASSEPRAVDPGHVMRVRSALPVGYEVAELRGPFSAVSLWGFGTVWTADPPQCARLADPAPADRGARGLSASGPGGIVYVAVIAAATPEPELLDQCHSWAMRFVHSGAQVRRTDAPAVDGADTVAWRARTRTVVESGAETNSDVVTAVAYLDHHAAFVTVVTDPGSPHPPLGPDFVDELLATTVTAVRD